MKIIAYVALFEVDQHYDLDKDPDEQNNLAGNPEYEEILAEMQKKIVEAP